MIDKVKLSEQILKAVQGLPGELGDLVAVRMSEGDDYTTALRETTRRHPHLWDEHIRSTYADRNEAKTKVDERVKLVEAAIQTANNRRDRA